MRVLVLVMLPILLAAPCAAKAADCILRMSAETDFPPHLIQQDHHWTGLSVDLMQRLADEVDCELVFINTPWLRAIQMSEQGELDVLSHLSYSDARKTHLAFIGPHHIESIYLVGNPSALPKADNMQQLANGTDFGSIATLHGAYYGDEFEQLSKQPALAQQLVSISSIQDKLALLRAGRVKAILEDISVVQYWQQNHYADAERYQPLLKIHESPVYFGFSRTSLSPQRLKQLADTWQRLREQGEFTAIYQKYGITNYNDLVPTPIL